MADTEIRAFMPNNNLKLKLIDNGDDTYSLSTTITGREVEELIFFDALAITDTDYKVSATIDLKKYKKVSFYAYNSLDQTVKLFPQISGSASYYWDGAAVNSYGSYDNDKYAEIPPKTATNAFLLDTFFPELQDMVMQNIKWVARCEVAPTKGALTVVGWGVPN